MFDYEIAEESLNIIHDCNGIIYKRNIQTKPLFYEILPYVLADIVYEYHVDEITFTVDKIDWRKYQVNIFCIVDFTIESGGYITNMKIMNGCLLFDNINGLSSDDTEMMISFFNKYMPHINLPDFGSTCHFYQNMDDIYKYIVHSKNEHATLYEVNYEEDLEELIVLVKLLYDAIYYE